MINQITLPFLLIVCLSILTSALHIRNEDRSIDETIYGNMISENTTFTFINHIQSSKVKRGYDEIMDEESDESDGSMDDDDEEIIDGVREHNSFTFNFMAGPQNTNFDCDRNCRLAFGRQLYNFEKETMEDYVFNNRFQPAQTANIIIGNRHARPSRVIHLSQEFVLMKGFHDLANNPTYSEGIIAELFKYTRYLFEEIQFNNKDGKIYHHIVMQISNHDAVQVMDVFFKVHFQFE